MKVASVYLVFNLIYILGLVSIVFLFPQFHLLCYLLIIFKCFGFYFNFDGDVAPKSYNMKNEITNIVVINLLSMLVCGLCLYLLTFYPNVIHLKGIVAATLVFYTYISDINVKLYRNC